MSALTEDLPDELARFMARHPEIKVEIEEHLSGDTVRALVEGLADIGVRAAGTPTHGLTVAPRDRRASPGVNHSRFPRASSCPRQIRHI